MAAASSRQGEFAFSLPNVTFFLLKLFANYLRFKNSFHILSSRSVLTFTVFAQTSVAVLYLLAYESSKRFTRRILQKLSAAPPRGDSLSNQAFWIPLRSVILLGFGFDGTFYSQNDD